MYVQSVIPKPVTEYDLRLLRIFMAVVEHSGFSAAASALGLTRSTVSVHMSNLETRMGLKLCNRGRSGFSLTTEGQTVYHGISQLFQSFDDFSILVSSLGKELSGEVVIMCADQLDAVKQQKLADVIAELAEQAPNLNIALDGDSISNIEKALLNDKAHVGLYPKYQAIDGLEYQGLFSENIFLCCAERHPFFSLTDSQISQQMLSETNAVHPGVNIDVVGREQLKQLKLTAKSYQFDTRKTLILSGKYIGYLPQSAIQQELNAGKMRIIKPQQCYYPFNLSLAYKKSARERAKVQLLNDLFAKHFA